MKEKALYFLATAMAVALATVSIAAQSSPPAKPAGTAQSKPAGTQAKPAGSAAAKPTAPSTTYDKALLSPATLKAQAPAEFDVKFVTTKGEFTMHVTRSWAPVGADRFYNLVKHHYFDGCAFFRVISGFVAQFGISPYPVVAKAWDNAKIKDDPVVHHNTPGTVVYAAEQAKNTRTTQLFINFGDNTRSLDPQGFAPFGEVTGSGMDVVKQFYGGYGGDLDQEAITNGGAAYIKSKYPQMDSIKTATIVAPAAPAKPAQ